MVKTKHLTVMFTDIRGFTSKTSSRSREQVEKLLDLHEKLLIPVFVQYEGTVVKTIGDAFLVTFESPTDAVHCGIKIQEVLDKHNRESKDEEDKIEVRVGINTGEVHVKNNDVFGEPVNIASRIESIAKPGEIFFTEAVYLAMNKKEIPSAEIGYRHLKGIPNEIKVYKVIKEGDSKRRKKKIKHYDNQKRGFFPWLWRKKWWILGFIVLVIIFKQLALIALVAYFIGLGIVTSYKRSRGRR